MAPVRNPEGGKADSFTQMHASLTHTLGELKEKSEAVATETRSRRRRGETPRSDEAKTFSAANFPSFAR